MLEPAGHSFHYMARVQAGDIEWSSGDGDDDDSSDSDYSSAEEDDETEEEEEIRPAGIPRPKAKKGANDKKKEKRDDLYKYLGLENERWMATEV